MIRWPIRVLQSLSFSLALLLFMTQSVWAYALEANFWSAQKAQGLSRNETVVLHFQDVHLNPEAQRQMAEALHVLFQDQTVDLVALEGAFEPFPFDRFRRYPRPSTIHAVADYFFQQHRLTGPVYAGFTSPSPIPPYVGVDDEALYNAHIQAYQKAAPQQEQQKKRLQQEQRDLRKTKTAVFNPALLAFDQMVQAHRQNERPLGAYVEFLMEAPSSASYPMLEVFVTSLALEDKLQLKRIQKEHARVLETLLQKTRATPAPALWDLSRQLQTHRIKRKDFYEQLQALCQKEGVSLDSYDALNDYITYLNVRDQIEVRVLFQEIRARESARYEALIQTDQERRLVERSRELYLKGKLLNFSLTPEEWEEYKALTIGDLDDFEGFYRFAEARDRAMADNLLSALETHNANVAVLVTGGFHSPGIERRFKENNIKTITVTPQLTKIPAEKGATQYLNTFTQEKTPLDHLFEGRTLFVPPPTWFAPSWTSLVTATLEGRLHTLNPTDDSFSSRESLRQLAPSLSADQLRFRHEPHQSRVTLHSQDVILTTEDGAIGSLSVSADSLGSNQPLVQRPNKITASNPKREQNTSVAVLLERELRSLDSDGKGGAREPALPRKSWVALAWAFFPIFVGAILFFGGIFNPQSDASGSAHGPLFAWTLFVRVEMGPPTVFLALFAVGLVGAHIKYNSRFISRPPPGWHSFIHRLPLPLGVLHTVFFFLEIYPFDPFLSFSVVLISVAIAFMSVYLRDLVTKNIPALLVRVKNLIRPHIEHSPSKKWWDAPLGEIQQLGKVDSQIPEFNLDSMVEQGFDPAASFYEKKNFKDFQLSFLKCLGTKGVQQWVFTQARLYFSQRFTLFSGKFSDEILEPIERFVNTPERLSSDEAYKKLLEAFNLDGDLVTEEDKDVLSFWVKLQNDRREANATVHLFWDVESPFRLDAGNFEALKDDQRRAIVGPDPYPVPDAIQILHLPVQFEYNKQTFDTPDVLAHATYLQVKDDGNVWGDEKKETVAYSLKDRKDLMDLIHRNDFERPYDYDRYHYVAVTKDGHPPDEGSRGPGGSQRHGPSPPPWQGPDYGDPPPEESPDLAPAGSGRGWSPLLAVPVFGTPASDFPIWITLFLALIPLLMLATLLLETPDPNGLKNKVIDAVADILGDDVRVDLEVIPEPEFLEFQTMAGVRKNTVMAELLIRKEHQFSVDIINQTISLINTIVTVFRLDLRQQTVSPKRWKMVEQRADELRQKVQMGQPPLLLSTRLSSPSFPLPFVLNEPIEKQGLLIRPIEDEDLDEIVTLSDLIEARDPSDPDLHPYQLSMGDRNWEKGRLQRYLSQPTVFGFVLVQAEHVVGFMMYEVRNRAIRILDFDLHSSLRNQQNAHLIPILFETAKSLLSRAIPCLRIYVRPSNVTLSAYLQKDQGFEDKADPHNPDWVKFEFNRPPSAQPEPLKEPLILSKTDFIEADRISEEWDKVKCLLEWFLPRRAVPTAQEVKEGWSASRLHAQAVRVDETYLGLFYYDLFDRRFHLNGLAVSPAAQGRNIGTQMIDKLKHKARYVPDRILTADFDPRLYPDLVRLLKKNGFVHTTEEELSHLLDEMPDQTDFSNFLVFHPSGSQAEASVDEPESKEKPEPKEQKPVVQPRWRSLGWFFDLSDKQRHQFLYGIKDGTGFLGHSGFMLNTPGGHTPLSPGVAGFVRDLPEATAHHRDVVLWHIERDDFVRHFVFHEFSEERAPWAAPFRDQLQQVGGDPEGAHSELVHYFKFLTLLDVNRHRHVENWSPLLAVYQNLNYSGDSPTTIQERPLIAMLEQGQLEIEDLAYLKEISDGNLHRSVMGLVNGLFSTGFATREDLPLLALLLGEKWRIYRVWWEDNGDLDRLLFGVHVFNRGFKDERETLFWERAERALERNDPFIQKFCEHSPFLLSFETPQMKREAFKLKFRMRRLGLQDTSLLSHGLLAFDSGSDSDSDQADLWARVRQLEHTEVILAHLNLNGLLLGSRQLVKALIYLELRKGGATLTPERSVQVAKRLDNKVVPVIRLLEEIEKKAPVYEATYRVSRDSPGYHFSQHFLIGRHLLERNKLTGSISPDDVGFLRLKDYRFKITPTLFPLLKDAARAVSDSLQGTPASLALEFDETPGPARASSPLSEASPAGHSLYTPIPAYVGKTIIKLVKSPSKPPLERFEAVFDAITHQMKDTPDPGAVDLGGPVQAVILLGHARGPWARKMLDTVFESYRGSNRRFVKKAEESRFLIMEDRNENNRVSRLESIWVKIKFFSSAALLLLILSLAAPKDIRWVFSLLALLSLYQDFKRERPKKRPPVPAPPVSPPSPRALDVSYRAAQALGQQG